jgi:Hsp70 protein
VGKCLPALLVSVVAVCAAPGLQLKKVLSANAEAPIGIECLMNDVDVQGRLTREEFEDMAKPMLERVRAVCVKVGGASRMLQGCCPSRALFSLLRRGWPAPQRTMLCVAARGFYCLAPE